MIDRVLPLHARLAKLGVNAVLFNTSEVTPSANLRYLTGFTGSDAAILITRTERRLFTDARYKTQAHEQARGFLVHVVRNKLSALTRTLRMLGVRRLGIEATRVSYELVTRLVSGAPGLEVIPLKRDFLEAFRVQKSPEETAIVKKAARIASQACRQVLSSGLIGRRESEVAADVESYFRSGGAESPSFQTIVASGARSALPHAAPTEKAIRPGELVVIDYGCRYQGYCSDETVTCCTAKPTHEQTKIHRAVHDAHMRALDAVREGISVRELDHVARSTIESAGYGKYFLHGLGHGVGLEIHEPPYLSSRGTGVLSEGMVFTIEPGVYIEGVGGVRLESLVYLGSAGPEVLCDMPKDLIIVG